MFFPSFPFSKKSGLFFARLVARNFTRALGTPSARLRMGHATRAALNAGRWQRGQLLSQMAVKGGGIIVSNHHWKKQIRISYSIPRQWQISGCGWGLVIDGLSYWCLVVSKSKRKNSTAMLELGYLYFDWLASFIRHLLILIIIIQEECGLKSGFFQKSCYFFINHVARKAYQQ